MDFLWHHDGHSTGLRIGAAEIDTILGGVGDRRRRSRLLPGRATGVAHEYMGGSGGHESHPPPFSSSGPNSPPRVWAIHESDLTIHGGAPGKRSGGLAESLLGRRYLTGR